MLGEANHLYQTHLDDRVGQLGGEQKTARLHVAVVHLNRSISRSGSARGPRGHGAIFTRFYPWQPIR